MSIQSSVVRHSHSPIWNVRTEDSGYQRSVWGDETNREWRRFNNSKRKTLRTHRDGSRK